VPLDQPDWTESVLVGLAGLTAVGSEKLRSKTVTVPEHTSGITVWTLGTTTYQLWNWGCYSLATAVTAILSASSETGDFTLDVVCQTAPASDRIAGVKVNGAVIDLQTTTETHARHFFVLYSVTT
jgi:hypothetical protein